ncbi:MAG TPA: SAM-dependent methyltransferase, partial [Planctomycetota bacterium]|nr:SAM-dependent methyltransferase [Planctomycetota bacterium]
WPGGDPEYPIEPISRAAAKLREALTHLDPPLAPGSSALDVGAAPGGFTSVLLDRGARVLAIDPAPLDARLAGRPGLTAFRGYADDFPLERVPALDLITCDAVCRPADVARFLARFVTRLSPSGRAIITLKLRPAPPPGEQIRGAAAVFEPLLALERVRHLFANRCEVTAFFRAHAAGARGA